MQSETKRRSVCHDAYRLACHIAKDMDSYSILIDPAREEAVTRFDRDEMVLGDLLGSGGFNNVFELDAIDLLDNKCVLPNDQQEQQRLCMAQRTNTKSKKYAVKLLKYEMIYNKKSYCNGAADLVIETKLLASLKPHPNIIRLHGMAEVGIAGFGEDIEGGYFLILDRLKDTLDNRMVTWRHQQKTTNKNIQQEQMKVAYEISSALKHLHKNKIIFRDLKPDNVGFDQDGNVKLFDFGLAKELNPKLCVTEDTYRMTGKTGSPRYMAPEVMCSKPYGLQADVYSYAIVLYEIFAMEEAFKNMTISDYMNFVVNGTHRPTLDFHSWPDKICKIMHCSWVQDSSMRPSMAHIQKALKTEILSQQRPERTTLPQPMECSKTTNNNLVGDSCKTILHPFPPMFQSKATSSKSINNSFKPKQLSPSSSLMNMPRYGFGAGANNRNAFGASSKNRKNDLANALRQATAVASRSIDL